MNILWCGGEDIDFPNGGATPFISTGAGNYRSAYARCAIINNSSGTGTPFFASAAFPGGAVTSAWLSFQASPFSRLASRNYFGVYTVGTTKGLFIGIDTVTDGKLALFKYDGTTRTQLAAESNVSIPVTGVLSRFDIQIINYGVSATVNVYFNKTLVITYTGDVTLAGMSSFNGVAIPTTQGVYISEVIVADADTRSLLGLQTLALTGAGATANWTNPTYTNINAATISDATPASSNVNNQVQDYNITDAVAGTYTPIMLKIAARLAKSSSGAAVNQVQLGYNNGSGSSGAGAGAAKTVSTAYANYEQYDAANPMTGAGWLQSQLNALQLELMAKT